ncbi:MAG: hypothetical protein CAPSK01_001444 [Candidatus Accumulibacter vicinus]|uniref:Uncharacterized protein n=1 Tax=Candidatus Accumulibacter vicinus TaxID=2954382 RepID=A0A084Y1J7_9PROT|nr:MAG: hypothetical protein CAPSK01_001444 [Candidatus Accumulibacter vicinus]
MVEEELEDAGLFDLWPAPGNIAAPHEVLGDLAVPEPEAHRVEAPSPVVDRLGDGVDVQCGEALPDAAQIPGQKILGERLDDLRLARRAVAAGCQVASLLQLVYRQKIQLLV